MRTRFTALTLLLGLSVLAGCATTFDKGIVAAREGRYADASHAFKRVLAKDPNRLDVLVNLGITRYKLGAFDEAIALLESAEARAPRDATVQLYLGLSHLRKGEVSPAAKHLTAFADLRAGSRIAVQTQRALQLLQRGPIDAETHAFVAASLDDEAELLRELNRAQRALMWGVPAGRFSSARGGLGGARP